MEHLEHLTPQAVTGTQSQARELMMWHYDGVYSKVWDFLETSPNMDAIADDPGYIDFMLSLYDSIDTKHHLNKCRKIMSVAYPLVANSQLSFKEYRSNELLVEMEHYKMTIKINDTRSKMLKAKVKKIVAELKKRGEKVDE